MAASATVFAIVLSRRQRRRKNKVKRLWTTPWIQMRQQHGAYNCLLRELRMSDKPSYKNFLRMDEGAFEELLAKVSPLIAKQYTLFRESYLLRKDLH